MPYNVPQGSVVVTAGGVTLQEGSDYTVDYSAGEVTILNQSIIDAGTNVNVSLESNTDYGMQRKTMFGVNWEYDFSKNFILGGTLMHLSEQALTSKVGMGEEPLNNTLWGLNLNWKQESQWLTNMLDKIPLLHVTQPSQIQFTGEFAQLIAGKAGGTQDNASYLDDFENTKNLISVGDPKSWVLASVPTMMPGYNDKTGVTSGYDRALLAWYNVDPIFTRRSSSLTPAHIKSDLNQLSDHRVREVYVKELYPNRDQSTYNGATSTLSVLNLAYYPQERGPYNLTTSLNPDGTLTNPASEVGRHDAQAGDHRLRAGQHRVCGVLAHGPLHLPAPRRHRLAVCRRPLHQPRRGLGGRAARRQEVLRERYARRRQQQLLVHAVG